MTDVSKVRNVCCLVTIHKGDINKQEDARSNWTKNPKYSSEGGLDVIINCISATVHRKVADCHS